MSLLPLFLIVMSLLSILILISGVLTAKLLTNYHNLTVSHTKMIAHFSSRKGGKIHIYIHFNFCPFEGAVDALNQSAIFNMRHADLLGI